MMPKWILDMFLGPEFIQLEGEMSASAHVFEIFIYFMSQTKVDTTHICRIFVGPCYPCAKKWTITQLI